MPRVECTRIGVSCEGNPVHIEGEQVVGVSKSLVASPSGFRSTIQLVSYQGFDIVGCSVLLCA